MAVPEMLRGEGKFTLLIKAQELATYTIKIVANEKVFNPLYTRNIIDDIVFCAKEQFLLLSEANDINVQDESDWRKRRRCQLDALRYLKRLLRLIDIAHRVFHLPTSRVKYWGGLVIEMRIRVEKWNKKDTDRYSSY